MSHYIWSIPAVLLMYILYALLTKQNNTQSSITWFWFLSFVGAFPLWSFVSRVSKNLLMDSLVYDSCMVLAYVGTLIFIGEARAFNVIQWFGLICCILGLLFMKVGG